jgi:hypothetical protein
MHPNSNGRLGSPAPGKHPTGHAPAHEIVDGAGDRPGQARHRARTEVRLDEAASAIPLCGEIEPGLVLRIVWHDVDEHLSLVVRAELAGQVGVVPFHHVGVAAARKLRQCRNAHRGPNHLRIEGRTLLGLAVRLQRWIAGASFRAEA